MNAETTLEQKKADATDAAQQLNTASLNARANAAAEKFLEHKGFTIVDSNYECSAGAIELVARDDEDALHFVQVNVAVGMIPEEPTSEADRKRLEHIALSYLMENEQMPGRIVFDCISIAAISASGNISKAMLKFHSNIMR